MELQHGCRAEYGPLELRIQTTASLNGFMVYVEDPRLDSSAVHEHEALGTVESAQESAVLQANEYLNSRKETCPHVVEWRCS